MAIQKSDLNNKVAIIIGAGGNIGMATASVLSSSGATVIGIVRKNPEEVQKKLDMLAPGKHSVLVADAVIEQQLINCLDKITQCDILINAVGFSTVIAHSDFFNLSGELFDEILSVNLKSVYLSIKTFTPLLRKSSNGLIVNISSSSSSGTGGSNIAYSAAKAGVDSLTRNLAKSLAPIRVISINPHAINNGFVNQSEDFYKKVEQQTPLKRLATAEDVATTVLSLACDIKFITGVNLLIDGGITL